MTHHDIDHIGSLAAIVKESPHQIEVLAHEKEKPFIQGELPPVKLTSERIAQIENQLGGLPEPTRRAIMSTFKNFSQFCTPVTHTVYDREELSICGGITVIHTPGHTPGHLCLYLQQSRTLIAGDALYVENETLVPGPTLFNHDSAEAIQSLKKLARFDIESVICYHGGIFKDNPNQRIAKMVQV